MNRIDFEKYKEEKIEYDKEIRKLDYKIVEESVQLYNLLNRLKAVETKMIAKENNKKIYKLTDSIDKSEKEKVKLTKQIFSKFELIKKELLKDIESSAYNFNSSDNNLLISRIALNKIQDVYFDLSQIEPIINYLELEKQNSKQLENNNVNKEIIKEESEKFIPKTIKQEAFDIPKQRIIDFENLLKYMQKISKNYREEIEKEISEYISKYDILNNSLFVQNKFNNIKDEYTVEFNETISKFKKDENLEEINYKVQNLLENNKKLENQKQNLLIETQVMKEKIEKLQGIYLVHNYAKKILDKFLILQIDEENKIKSSQIMEDDEIFKKIQKVTYDERMKHIIEVSKWTKQIESKLKYKKIKENDFQVIIYTIRQTEDICNINYENITNQILKLCEAYIELEEIEKVNDINKQILNQDVEISNILKDGINTIKKKYLKIPFIGRKVAYILDSKALNA